MANYFVELFFLFLSLPEIALCRLCEFAYKVHVSPLVDQALVPCVGFARTSDIASMRHYAVPPHCRLASTSDVPIRSKGPLSPIAGHTAELIGHLPVDNNLLRARLVPRFACGVTHSLSSMTIPRM